MQLTISQIGRRDKMKWWHYLVWPFVALAGWILNKILRIVQKNKNNKKQKSKIIY